MTVFCSVGLRYEDYKIITDAVDKKKWRSKYAFIQEAVTEKLIKEGLKSESHS